MGVDLSIVINARVDSTRVRRKIVRDFCGTTLLDLALERVKDIDVPKYVATCEDEILDIVAKHNGFKILERDALSVKKGTRDQSITFAHYRNVPTSKIMMINSCCPFVEPSTYEGAINEIFKEKHTTLTTVKKINNVFFDSEFCPINAPLREVSTLNNSPIYEMSHLFHIFDKSFFVNNGYFWDYSSGHPFLYEVGAEESLDIDFEMDFEICELMWRKKNETNN